jgi:phospholipase C
MMENHSFDNYFGMLPVRGQPLADGFTFNGQDVPQNENPLDGGYNRVFHLASSTCQTAGNNQTWAGTREQINGGAMNGFASSDREGMGYYDEPDIPFYYSLAKTFCLGNRAFCSATAQTYPNRRYLYAATSGGLIETSSATFSMPAPANGTLMDMMTKYGVSWMNYFTDLPATAIVPQNLENHPSNYAPVSQFLVDCVAGTLPNVSFVDPEFGLAGDVGQDLFHELTSIPNLPASVAASLAKMGYGAGSVSGDEEPPANIQLGEAFAAEIINAVIESPLWPETLLIWTYDEHGGYYDHVQPLGAVEPDNIPPNVTKTDPPGAFNITGIRVPTVVVSPYSRPGAVSNVPHDHTSIIATIAAKWNLPALTYRDAQANTLFDYLNLSAPPALLNPPALAAPATNGSCNTTPQTPVISPAVKQRRAP